MNKAIKKQWVDALRSGKYVQGKRALHILDPTTFCCLGVLCELAVKAGIVNKFDVGYTVFDKPACAYGQDELHDLSTQSLPSAVMDWANLLHPRGPEVVISGSYDRLTVHNDTGKTFNQIADAIEKHL